MSREKQNKGITGEKGTKGPPGVCPACRVYGPTISWDADTGVSTCTCGWSREEGRDKQIEEISKVIKSSLDGLGYGNFNFTGDEFSIMVSKALYNAGYRKQSEWVSVDERLPEEAGRAYLVWDNVQATVKKRFFYRIPLNMPVETYPYIREYFGNVSDYKRYTHWMPLPTPPKGD